MISSFTEDAWAKSAAKGSYRKEYSQWRISEQDSSKISMMIGQYAPICRAICGGVQVTTSLRVE